MVNVPTKKLVPLPAGNYSKATKRSTRRPHHANQGNSGLEAELVRGVGALRSLRSKKMLAAGKSQETHFLNNEEKEIMIED